MLISQLSIAAKKAGLSIKSTVAADPLENTDASILLSNDVEIQMSSYGRPLAVTFIQEQPEWTMWDTYFEHPGSMTPDAVITKALELKTKVDLDRLVAARLADHKVQAANKDIIRRAKLAGHIS